MKAKNAFYIVKEQIECRTGLGHHTYSDISHIYLPSAFAKASSDKQAD